MGSSVTPRVLNIKTASPEQKRGAVYIGRPSKWGNPFRLGYDGNRDEVIAKFEDYAKANLMPYIHQLRGKNLLCFCHPQKCHGDVLVRLSNQSHKT